jgi:hypothetical protein
MHAAHLAVVLTPQGAEVLLLAGVVTPHALRPQLLSVTLALVSYALVSYALVSYALVSYALVVASLNDAVQLGLYALA